MAQRSVIPQLGIVFDYNTNWMGGTYYIFNLLHAVASLPAEEQPRIVIYGNSREGYETVIKEVPELNISYVQSSVLFKSKFKRGVNLISRKITGKNLFDNRPQHSGEVIFPNPRGSFFEKAPHRVFWIPDFQEKYYPGFFSAEDLAFRESFTQNMIAEGLPVVFSSRDAESDFRKFYPQATNKIYVLPFAVSIKKNIVSDINALQEQYGLNGPYFITPNQFWVHKNHKVIIEAAALLKKEGYQFNILFSGKNYDPRCPEYTGELKEIVAAHVLEDTVKFLGFLDRDVLLCLIQNAAAVIQPSLFEGWSTVVEDAKALSKPVIASSLNVHKEQMGDKGRYFDPLNAVALKDQMALKLQNNMNSCDWNYDKNRIAFAQQFMNMVKEVAQ